MKRIDLNGEYLLYSYDYQFAPEHPQLITGDGIPAIVPGNVELDYQRAGMLDDIFYAQNFREAAKLEWKDFWYVRQFELSESLSDRDVQLCFDGVDTIAEYFLNGIKIGESDNMLIGFRFAVGDALRRGENTLAVHIRSAVAYAKRYDIRPYNVAFPGCYENLHIRKAAINYGWDISPRVLSAGIWKDVYLEIHDEVFFQDVYLATASVYEDVAVLVLSCNTAMPDEYISKSELRIAGSCKEHSFSAQYPLPYLGTTVYPYVRGAKLWNPLGMGEQNLYDITLQILCEEKVLAEHKMRYGIRTAELKFGETTGENGTFALYINNKLVRCKGANHVPVSLLHSQDRDAYLEVVQNFRDSNCNMVRVWGGGVYEGEEFFDLCDEYGIMVWQDMMIACHAYPMTDEFYHIICRECEAVARRIRNHPSLVFYCGGNETDWPYVCVGLDPNDDIITRGAMKNTLYQFDPFRTYLPSTPYFSREFIREHGGRFYLDLEEIKQERTSLPDEHYWWHREDFLNDREQDHKFISEIGYSSASDRASLNRYLPKGYTFDDDAIWQDHSYPTEGKRGVCIEYLFEGMPQEDDAKFLASQHYQAEAYKYVIELCRIRDYNNGILLWTMRENWPSFSSALVDYYGRRKIAFYTVRASYEPLQCIIDLKGNIADCYLVNDRLDAKKVTVMIRDEQGSELYCAQVAMEENVPVMKLAALPLNGEKLLLTEVREEETTIRNYRYVYSDKIFWPEYRKLYETQIGEYLNER